MQDDSSGRLRQGTAASFDDFSAFMSRVSYLITRYCAALWRPFLALCRHLVSAANCLDKTGTDARRKRLENEITSAKNAIKQKMNRKKNSIIPATPYLLTSVVINNRSRTE